VSGSSCSCSTNLFLHFDNSSELSIVLRLSALYCDALPVLSLRQLVSCSIWTNSCIHSSLIFPWRIYMCSSWGVGVVWTVSVALGRISHDTINVSDQCFLQMDIGPMSSLQHLCCHLSRDWLSFQATFFSLSRLARESINMINYTILHIWWWQPPQFVKCIYLILHNLTLLQHSKDSCFVYSHLLLHPWCVHC
jgi:hypothetical protein